MWFLLVLISASSLMQVHGRPQAPDLSKLPPSDPAAPPGRELVARGADGASLSGQPASTDAAPLGTDVTEPIGVTEPVGVTETVEPTEVPDAAPTAKPDPSADGKAGPSETGADVEAPPTDPAADGGAPPTDPAADESSTVAPSVTEQPGTPAAEPEAEPEADESGTPSATAETSPLPTEPPSVAETETALQTEQPTTAAPTAFATEQSPADSEVVTETAEPGLAPATAPPTEPAAEGLAGSEQTGEAEKMRLPGGGGSSGDTIKDSTPVSAGMDEGPGYAMKDGKPKGAKKDSDKGKTMKDDDTAEAAKNAGKTAKDDGAEETMEDADPAAPERKEGPEDTEEDGDPMEMTVNLNDVYNQGVTSHIDGPSVLSDSVHTSMKNLFLRPRQVAYQLGRHTVSTHVTQLEVSGIDKMIILNVSSNVDDMSLNVTFQFPEITFTGRFNATGSILKKKQAGVLVLRAPFPSYGSGNIKAVIVNTTAVSQAELSHSFNDRKLSIELLTCHLTFGEPQVSLTDVRLPRALRKLHFERLFRVALGKTIARQLPAEVEPQVDRSLHDVITTVLDRVTLDEVGASDFATLVAGPQAWLDAKTSDKE